MITRFFFSLILLCAALSLSAAGELNILLFTADDLHAESLGVYGSKIADLTPNLDKFSAQGMRFDRAHVNNAICAPSRAIIATGLYSHRSGAMGFMHTRPEIPNLIDTFKQNDYLTGILGKVSHSTPKETSEWDYAFDQKELGNGRNPEIYYQRSKVFLERCKKENKPFYFMVNSHDPHRPFCNPKKLTKGAAIPSQIYKPSEVSVPGFLPDLPGVREEIAMYLNSTRRLDDTFGKVMQALDELGYADNTLVIFMSDNGIAVPFAKCNTWFHSSRTPFLVRWPNEIKAGSVNKHDFISEVDLAPSLIELTGIKGMTDLDGQSIVSLLKGEKQDGRECVYTQIDAKAGGAAVPMRAVQNNNFIYIYNAFCDGKVIYKNNNEGLSMKAMVNAAAEDPEIAARVDLFRKRIPEEFYNLKKDQNCLVNLMDNPKYIKNIQALQEKLITQMTKTDDPMLKAFKNRNDRAIVDQVIVDTYGKLKSVKKKRKKKEMKKDLQ